MRDGLHPVKLKPENVNILLKVCQAELTVEKVRHERQDFLKPRLHLDSKCISEVGFDYEDLSRALSSKSYKGGVEPKKMYVISVGCAVFSQ